MTTSETLNRKEIVQLINGKLDGSGLRIVGDQDSKFIIHHLGIGLPPITVMSRKSCYTREEVTKMTGMIFATAYAHRVVSPSFTVHDLDDRVATAILMFRIANGDINTPLTEEESTRAVGMLEEFYRRQHDN
jgi:hypothetical protein